ncbi:gpi transamidase component pig [Ophiostoma piceae UAMH 11346]|uniref:Gpi transamidase component pig n=1 Tax=Ophiostoma piceae (strain UAMH 11346) TaxID=1262450 RepID=S3C7Z0_OPHP1|nr:gpi transamidase component pig [Ophiostoma piceae UAMH 11346]
MTLLSRLCLLLTFSPAIANGLGTSLFVPRAAAGNGCLSDKYTSCGGNLPSDFCCAAGSTCVVTYGTSSSENTTAICCPTGTDCTVIAPITCSIQMLNVTAYPGSPVLTTELDTDLTTCASKCCPPGYVCNQNTCVQVSKKVVSADSVSTRVGGSSAVPSMFITASTASESASATLPTAKGTSTKGTTTTSKVVAKTTLSSSTKASIATSATSSSVAAGPASVATPTPTSEPSPDTTKLSKSAVVGLSIALVASAILLAMLALCYRRRLLQGWRRFKSSFSSSRSTRSSSSSVKYMTTDNAPPLQRPAPTWAIPLSADWWWEPVKRQWPWVKPPWQSPRPSSAGWPKSHASSTTFTTPLSCVSLPISRFNTHHDPETGIVTSPPSRSAAGFSTAPGPNSPKKAKKTKNNIRNRLSSGFYRIKSLPPIPQIPSTLFLSSNFASAPAHAEMTAANSVHGLNSQPFPLPRESPPMMPQEVEGSPVPTVPKTPQSSHTHSTLSEHELERVHNTPLLPVPVQPRSPPKPSPWPRPLRLSRQPSDNSYTPVIHATAHGRSVSNTPSFRQRLGVGEHDAYHQQQPRQRISQLPPVQLQPLPQALQTLPSQASALPASPASAIPESTRNRLYQPPRRSASPIELPATPVTARMLGASIPPLGRQQYAETNAPINAFGIISGGGEDELRPRPVHRQRPDEYHRHTSYIPRGHNFAPAYGDPQPVCPYPRARDSLGAPPAPPILMQPQAQSLPSLMTGAPTAPPHIPIGSAAQPRFRSTSSPLSMVIHQQKMQQQACQRSQSPMSAIVETPMTYHSVQSLQSPTTPLIEEAQVQRLPRMTQARMMQQYQQPSIVVVVRPPSGETVPGSARNSS